MEAKFAIVLTFLTVAAIGCTSRNSSTREHARWNVKTLQDLDTEWLTSGGLYPAITKRIEELNAEDKPDELHNDSPRQSRERQLVVVGGWILEKPRRQADGDIHLKLYAEDNIKSAYIQAEVPNAEESELADSRFSEYFRAVGTWVDENLASKKDLPAHVMVMGVRYFDNSHHKDGDYSAEIHPVLGIRWAR
jgi:hypothetical protein